jgi:cell division protein ZipA
VTRDTGKRPRQDDDDLLDGITSVAPEDEGENLDWLDGLVSDESRPKSDKADPATGKLPRDASPEVFMLNVVARSDLGFRGEDILQILLACDLRFGDMNFFHRHEFEAGRGAIQFSVANMLQPGVFDIDKMADMSTPGLVFFLTLPGPEDMIKAYDYMLETAQTVARNLGADVLDESRSVLTKQAVEHGRQKIRDLERRLLAKAH